MPRESKGRWETRILARKWRGDDEYSWAIFVNGSSEPVLDGLSQTEVKYYKKLIARDMKQREDEQLEERAGCRGE